MSEIQDGSLHMQGSVGDYFAIEAHILSTRTADAYRAIDKSRNAPVCLWVLRHPLALNSSSVERFLNRLSTVQAIEPPICDRFVFGVDSQGMAFAVLPPLDGFPVSENVRDIVDAERRFLSALRIIERLHNNGVACGDLCSSSFWVERNGEIKFVGLMGSFDSEASETSMLPPMDTLHFVGPEQRSGGGVEFASDTFALGVLGYQLFTGKFPYGQGGAAIGGIESVTPLSGFLTNPPIWSDEVLLRCLNPNPSNRFPRAGDIIKHMMEVRERATQQASMPMRLKREPQGGAQQFQLKSVNPNTPAAESADASSKPGGNILVKSVVVGVITFIAVAAGAFFMFAGDGLKVSPQPGAGKEPIASDIKSHEQLDTNPELKDAIHGVAKEADSLSEVDKKVETLVASDDPVAHDTMVRLAVDATQAPIRQRAERGIIDRARRLGLNRSAEEVRSWLRTIREGQQPPSYEPILRSLDTTVPMDARSRYLRQAYPGAPVTVLRLTAALGFDTGSLEEYQPVLSQLVGDSSKYEDASEHSALALVLGSRDLASAFGDDVVQRLSELPDKDVVWLLQILSDRKDDHIRAVSNVAIDRGLLPSVRKVFLELVRDRENLDAGIVMSLSKAAAGATEVEDIGRFGAWYDIESEKVLLAVCADSADPQLRLEAFDTLAGKSLSIQPSALLVQWIRRDMWSKRGDFAQAVGMLGLSSYYKPEQVGEALKPFDQFSKDQKLLNILFGNSSPVVVRALVERYKDSLGPSRLLGLLSAEDKDMRILAIQRLKDFNQVGLLQVIIENYEREKDPDVRKLYEESFWVIQQRKQQ